MYKAFYEMQRLPFVRDIPPEKLDVFLEVLDTIYQKSKDARHTQYRDVDVPEKG